MSKTIWVFPLEADSEQPLHAPKDAHCLHVDVDPAGELCLWLLVDPNVALETTPIYIVGTGNPVPPGAIYHLGTTVVGEYVWHVFSGKADSPEPPSGETMNLTDTG